MELTTINACKAALDAARAISVHVDSEMPWHQGIVFLIVATADPEEGVTQGEIIKKTGLSSSSVSRNVAALGDWHRLQRPGLQLVETREDLTDRRRKPIFLTQRGREVRNAIAESINRSLRREAV